MKWIKEALRKPEEKEKYFGKGEWCDEPDCVSYVAFTNLK